MAHKPSVIISAFADEAANRRTALEQMTALAALGIRNYSPRFIDVFDLSVTQHVNKSRAVVADSEGCQRRHLFKSRTSICGFIRERAEDY